MNRTIGIQLIVYSVLLACLSFLVHNLAPARTRPTLIAGLVGGGLCLAWGLRAVVGTRGKVLPILTLIPVSFTLLPQAFTAWFGHSEGIRGGRVPAAAITLLLLLSLVMLVRIAWAGVFWDVTPRK